MVSTESEDRALEAEIYLSQQQAVLEIKEIKEDSDAKASQKNRKKKKHDIDWEVYANDTVSRSAFIYQVFNLTYSSVIGDSLMTKALLNQIDFIKDHPAKGDGRFAINKNSLKCLVTGLSNAHDNKYDISKVMEKIKKNSNLLECFQYNDHLGEPDERVAKLNQAFGIQEVKPTTQKMRQ